MTLMASNLLLIVLIVLVSVTLSSGYSLSTGDAVLKQDDESYLMATSDQGTLMFVVGDVAKARSLQALVAGSKVVANKKSTSNKSLKKKKQKSKKSLDAVQKETSLDAAVVGIIIAVIVVALVIICVIYYFFHLRHKVKKAQSIEQGKIKESSETQTSKTEDHV